VKSHVKQHKVASTKLVPLLPNRTNPDEDSFIIVPKNSLAKGLHIALPPPATPSKSKMAAAVLKAAMGTLPVPSWNLKKSMGARHRVGIRLSYRPARLHRLAELMPWNRFLGSINV
jgi:hypothetical protein